MAKEMRIKQTNLNNGVVETGKFYSGSVDVFFGIKAYVNHDPEEVIRRLKAGETKFIVSWGINEEGKILYEVI